MKLEGFMMCMTYYDAVRRMRSLRRQQKDQLVRPFLAGKEETKTARARVVTMVMEK